MRGFSTIDEKVAEEAILVQTIDNVALGRGGGGDRTGSILSLVSRSRARQWVVGDRRLGAREEGNARAHDEEGEGGRRLALRRESEKEREKRDTAKTENVGDARLHARRHTGTYMDRLSQDRLLSAEHLSLWQGEKGFKA